MGYNLPAYDAVYVLLAGILPAPLPTRDTRFASTPGRGAEMEYTKPWNENILYPEGYEEKRRIK